MAKKLKTTEQKTVRKIPWENFSGIESGNWKITYSKKAGRGSLYDGDVFKMSDASLSSLQIAASDRYGVPLESWKKTEH